MHAESLPLAGGQAREREVVQVDETAEQMAGRIQLHCEAPFGEVDLHLACAPVEAAAHLDDMLTQQVFDERLPRVPGDALLRIQQAQSGRGDHGLLQSDPGIALGVLYEAVGIALVPERPGGEPGHAPSVAGGERNREAVGGGVRQTVDAVGEEVMEFALLAVADDGGARGLEPGDGVADGRVVQRFELRAFGRIGAVGSQRFDQGQRARNAADGLGRDVHAEIAGQDGCFGRGKPKPCGPTLAIGSARRAGCRKSARIRR